MHLFFQYLLFLVQTAWLLFAEHTSLFLLLLPVPPTLVQGSNSVQHLCHMACVTLQASRPPMPVQSEVLCSSDLVS